MKNKLWDLVGFALLALAFPAGVQAQLAPDLTTTDLATIDRTQTYNLGPTGMRGWIYHDGNNVGDFGTMSGQSPWQILVTTVGTGTPASGIMATDDVILGASAGAGAVLLFTNDSRKSLGWAIGAAEASPTGILNIKRWRAGVTTDVALQMGISNTAYSATAPYNCPKSALILSNAINKLPASFNLGNPGNPVLGLAMMASGNTNFNASVQTYARSIAPSSLSLNPNSCDTWGWGYMSVFLAEYYLKTGDTNVLSGITKYTVNLAKAQSKYGTFGHGGAEQHSDGSLHGSISWYGPVNSAGLVGNLGIAMGKKVIVASGGAVDAEIDPALDRASKFFGYFVGKGSIPYGEHEPWSGGHASNGKDNMAAFMFAMQGNRPVETEYYTRMTVAGYNGREYGHTGQGFSYLWSTLAANIGGTNAVATYLAQVRWHLDLSRRSDGSFVYDGAEQYGGSPNITDYWSNSSKYAGMDPTSWYVLAYSLPKQQLYLTGKNANPTNWLSSDKVTNAIWVGAFNQVCGGYDTNQLAAAMGDYDPGVRFWAAATIGTNAQTSYSMLTNMASSTNSLVREAACQALGVKQDTRALTLLSQRLSDTNIWVRSKASKALQSFGGSALSQLTTMLTAFTNNATDPNVIVWEDPIQIANGYLADLLFQTLGSSTINAATNLLYPAVIAGLKQPDGMARSYMGDFIQNRLTWTHVQAVAPAIIACVAERSPADRMFSDGIRLAGLATLGKYLVEEGIPLCLMFKEQTWHGDDWLPFDLLTTTYRGAAKDVLPTLYAWQAHQPQFLADGSIGGCCPGRYPTITNKIALAIAAISSDTSPPTLNNFKRIASANASPAVITLPTVSTPLSSVAAPDKDGGTPVFTWSKVSGAGTVSFTPNGTQASSNTVATFSGIGTYVVRVSAADSSILNSNIWITYSLGYYDFKTYTNVIGAVYSNITVIVNVPTNRAPVPQNQSLTTPVDTALGITLAATDSNGDALSYSVVTPPTNGTLTGAAPNLVYTPTNSFTGFDRFTFKANDGQVDSSIATITIDTGPVGNRRPVATNQSVTTAQNTAKAITLTGSDPDANPLTYLLVSSPTHGTLSGAVPNLTYLPATNYPGGNLNGPDSFTFAVKDTSSLTSGVATVSITVTPPGPVVGNGGGATNLTAGVAQLRGTLTNAPADVRFYWGTTDGGTNAANWAGTILQTNTTQTTFSSNVSNLLYGLTYYYRSYASNQYGTAWAPATAIFTTQRPVTPSPQTINVNFDSTIATGLSGPIGGFGTTWNQFGKDNALGTVHGSSLLDSTGGATGIGCSYVSSGSLDNWGSSGSLTMLQNAGYNGNNQISGGLSYPFEVNGLVSGRTYDLYIGSWYDNEQGSKGTFVTSNTTTNGLTQSVDNGWTAGGWTQNSSTWVQGVNYVAFRSIVANGSSKIAITMTADPGTGNRNPKLMVCGLQLLDLTPVLPALSLTNSAATNITANSAALNATLRSTGTVYQVSAFWNTVNGGTNATLWTNSAFVGAWTNLATVNLSFPASGLAGSRLYYFTFRATNAVETIWATNVQSFTTLVAAPGPIVDNGGGATNLSVGVAQLRGTLANGPADVRLYWGTTDGDTLSTNWANVSLLSGTPTGSFSKNVSNLTYGVTYFYRSHASNQWGTAWAASTTNFTTLRPASSLTNSAATGITITTAALKATLVCTGAVYNVVAYWNTVSGNTNAALWTNSAFVGAFTNVSGTNLTYAATGLAPGTTCYFTFRATNTLDSLWATNVQSFTTLALPGPTVDNAAGATNLSAGVAGLRGTLASGPADVRLYWGTTDGGTNKASWANAILLSSTPGGAFTANASNLIYGLTYNYRAYASNQWGAAWAPATVTFTSLKPLGAAAGVIPYTSMVEVSASEESSGYEVANMFNGNGLLGDGNTHSASGEWLSGGAQPVASQWVKVRFDQAYSLDYLRVWAFAEGLEPCVTNADVYVVNQASDPGNNLHLAGGPFNTTGWTQVLPQQGFMPTPTPGGSLTNTDPHISLGGVMARQLAFKINATAQDVGLAGFSEIQVYRLGPTPITLTNAAAGSITATTAGLNGALASPGAAYDVSVCWNTVNGGTNVAQWTNSAYVGSYSDVAAANLNYSASGLAPSTMYFFTFRATNVVETLWATNVQSFTTLAGGAPPVPVLPGSAITVAGGVPSFTFATVSGFKYRLVYKNALTSATWLPVIAPPNFPLPDGWSAVSTGSPMSLSDTNTVGQSQRFYRIEAASP